MISKSLFRRGLPVLVLLAGLRMNAATQITGYPFDTPADPRSIAMGESFSGVPSNPAALLYNPAGLGGLTGVSASWSRRGMNWISATDDWNLNSFTTAVAFPFGVVAAQYNRSSYGTMIVTTTESPDGNGTVGTLYAHDFALGFGMRLPSGVAIGVAAKYYDFIENFSGPLAYLLPTWTTKPAYLFDFGVEYTLPPLHAQAGVNDSLTLGLAMQNAGTAWKQTMAPDTYGDVSPDMTIKMPEYLRIGLSYGLRVVPADESSLSPFSAVVTGEWRSLLYPETSGNTTYWGAGVELTAYEVFSLRGGMAISPFDSFETIHDRAGFRIGAGINLPVRRLAPDIPLMLSFHYSLVALNPPGEITIYEQVHSTISALSIELHYDGSPW